MRKFLRDWAEIPGAVILLLLSFWQTILGGLVNEQVLNSRLFWLEDELRAVCRLVQADHEHLRAVFDSMKHNTGGVAVEWPGHVAEEAATKAKCLSYEPALPTDSFHLTFHAAKRIVDQVGNWMLLLGSALFVIGLVYRLHMWSRATDSP